MSEVIALLISFVTLMVYAYKFGYYRGEADTNQRRNRVDRFKRTI